MKKSLLAFILLAASLFGADLTGSWTFEVETDAGSGSPTFVLKQDGEKLTGTYAGALGNAEVTGTVKANRITIEFEASGAKVVYEGTIEENGTLKGTVDLGGQAKGTFTAARRK
jgi:hypothetical protein